MCVYVLINSAVCMCVCVCVYDGLITDRKAQLKSDNSHEQPKWLHLLS